MTNHKLRCMSSEQLVERFAAIGLEQDRALLENEIATFNRLFDQMQAVSRELKSRSGDQRRALMKLYQHPNMQVRLKSAVATLPVAPEAARHMLELIAQSGWQPQAGDAGMAIVSIDRGIFKPT